MNSMFLSLVISSSIGLICLAFLTSHPVAMAGAVIFFSGLVGLWLSQFLHLWALISLLLIFLGGMMVIFIYLTTLASMDKLVVTSSKGSWVLPAVFFAMFLSGSERLNYAYSLPLGTFYSHVSNTSLFLVTLYLLLGLLVIVKLSEAHKGSVSSW